MGSPTSAIQIFNRTSILLSSTYSPSLSERLQRKTFTICIDNFAQYVITLYLASVATENFVAKVIIDIIISTLFKKMFSVPLWALLAGQCLLTMVLFIAVFVSFNIQMQDSISDQVLLRIQGRVENVRETLLGPFVEAYTSLEALSVMSTVEPSKFAPSDNQSLAEDVEHYRYVGTLVKNIKSVLFVAQLYESKIAPLDPNGIPYLTYQVTANGFDSKEYGGRYNVFFQQAFKVNNSVYVKQKLSYQGNFAERDSPIFTRRLNDSTHRRFWTNYPVEYTTKSQTTIINATTGLPQVVEIVTVGFSQCAMYSTLIGQMGQGLRYNNSWMQVISIDLSSVEKILLTLTDLSDGETDSYSSLYDISATIPSEYQILAVSHPKQIAVVDKSTLTYLQATQSSSPDLNRWFTQALTLSQDSGSEEGAVHTDKRFLSYAHIRHAPSNLHLFAVVSTADHKYYTDVREVQKITIGVGVAYVVLVASLGILMAYFVSTPIRILKAGMALAATLQNEKVVSARSFLSEINSLCTAFARMNVLLTEAKAYMPASMMVRFSSSDDDDELAVVDSDEDDNSKMRVSGQVSNGTPSSQQSRQSRKIDNSRLDLRTGTTVTSGSHSPAVGADLITFLRNRRVAVLAVNVREFTALPGFSISTIGGHSTSLLDLISVAAASERGVIDSFHGDHFMISFNAVKPVASPGRKAVQCAAAIHNALSSTPYNRLSMGASCGPAVVGSLGNSSQRRLSIVGSCYTKAMRLQKAAAALELSLETLFSSDSPPANVFHCIIDATTKVECAEAFESIFVGLVRDKKVRSNVPHPEVDVWPIISTDSELKFAFNKQQTTPMSRGADKSPLPISANVPLAPIFAANSLDKKGSSKKVKLEATNTYAVVFELKTDRFTVITDEKAVGLEDDEWMYEMKQKSLKNPFRWVNEAMEAAISEGEKVEKVLSIATTRLEQLKGSPDSSVLLSTIITELGKLKARGDTNNTPSPTADNRRTLSSENLQVVVPWDAQSLKSAADANICQPTNSKEVAELSEWARIVLALNLSKQEGDFTDLVTI